MAAILGLVGGPTVPSSTCVGGRELVLRSDGGPFLVHMVLHHNHHTSNSYDWFSLEGMYEANYLYDDYYDWHYSTYPSMSTSISIEVNFIPCLSTLCIAVRNPARDHERCNVQE
jgi:hypothetical protein